MKNTQNSGLQYIVSAFLVCGSVLASLSYAELAPMDNSELSAVNGEGIAMRLEIGLGANPSADKFVEATIDDGSGLWEAGHLRSGLLGSCNVAAYVGGNVGNISNCTRRIAIEYNETGTSFAANPYVPVSFAILFDNFAVSATFEEIRMEVIEKSVGSTEGKLKFSFPGKIDISRLTIEKLSFVPLESVTDATNPMNLTAATSDAASLYAYNNDQINLLGIDVNATFKVDGEFYLFAHDLTNVNYGVEPAISGGTVTNPTYNANIGFLR